ncbi:bacteriocin immunity protein [Enterococcus hirae]
MFNISCTKKIIHELYNSLSARNNYTNSLLDITDVLLQVYKKIDTVKYPEILVNKLVNYIYIVGFNNDIHFFDEDEKLLRELGNISKKAGINSKYKANFSDKTQFYSYLEKMPIR